MWFRNPVPIRMEVHIWGNGTEVLYESWNGSVELNADTWTSNGGYCLCRCSFGFDLSSIPKTATIQGATLSLYSSHTPQNGNLVDANFGTNNSMVVQEITQSWDMQQRTLEYAAIYNYNKSDSDSIYKSIKSGFDFGRQALW